MTQSAEEAKIRPQTRVVSALCWIGASFTLNTSHWGANLEPDYFHLCYSGQLYGQNCENVPKSDQTLLGIELGITIAGLMFFHDAPVYTIFKTTYIKKIVTKWISLILIVSLFQGCSQGSQGRNKDSQHPGKMRKILFFLLGFIEFCAPFPQLETLWANAPLSPLYKQKYIQKTIQ